ncbi:GntR family transcriptional regulator [Streptomyces sp. NPDC050560]|uniref:GntR family transcriptional regulator n=1 Tax=Streptomyces sp. NPDC050560 TaxID=3365630 RepID=UPI00378D082E
MSEEADISVIDVDTKLSGRRISADYIADAMRQAINSGNLPDGAVLNQVALATHFGVSRVPVREALRQLQAEGLVESRAHRLTTVRGTDLERLVEVFSLRALVEGWLIEQAVARMSAPIVEAARQLNERLRDEADHTKWLELNKEFHMLLYRPSGAVVAMEMLDPLRSRSERYTRLWSRGSGIHRPQETCAEHEHILDLVESGDAAAARAAVEAHVLHTRDRVVEAGRRARGAAR